MQEVQGSNPCSSTKGLIRMPMVFITGAAGVGKSIIIEGLKKRLPRERFNIHDIDEADLWKDDYEAWRDKKIDYWLKQSQKNQSVITILAGIIYPKSVISAPSYPADQDVKYILIDASPRVHYERFMARSKNTNSEAVERKIRRHIEIQNELKSDLERIENVVTLDTTSLSPGDMVNLVEKKLTH